MAHLLEPSGAEDSEACGSQGRAALVEVPELFPELAVRPNLREANLSDSERQMPARALMVPSGLTLLEEPLEDFVPAVVEEVREAVNMLQVRASLIIVEHDGESVLAMAGRADVLANGPIAFDGSAAELSANPALQERLLRIVCSPAAAE